MSNVRLVGKQPEDRFGPRGPSQNEIDASVDSARGAPRRIPTGVYRYRRHTDANEAMDRWTVDAMVEQARKLAGPAY